MEIKKPERDKHGEKIGAIFDKLAQVKSKRFRRTKGKEKEPE